MPEPVVSIQDVVVDYPGSPPLRAVDHVSFDLYPGEVVGLVGESGCGKSTMARVITGIIRPGAGQVYYRGEPLPPMGLTGRSPRYTGIQMVFQDPGSSLNPRRRVGAQIADGIAAGREREAYEARHGISGAGIAAERAAAVPGLHPGRDGDTVPGLDPGWQPSISGAGFDAAANRDTPEQWLERIGMSAADAGRYPRHLSGGQRQRIAAARALAARPSLLIGDEPISALDASTQAGVAYLMCTLAQEQSSALLFISHDLSVVRLIADRLIVMYRGHIVERGPTDAVWSNPLHPYTRALLGAIPAPDGAGRLPLVTPPGTSYPLEEAVRD